MANIFYETAPMPPTDGTNVVVNEDGKIDLGESVTTKLQNIDENGKIDASNVKYGNKSVSEELQSATTPNYMDIRGYVTKGNDAPSDLIVQSAQIRIINNVAQLDFHLCSPTNGISANGGAILNINWNGIGVKLPKSIWALGFANNYGANNMYPQSGYTSAWLFTTNGVVDVRPFAIPPNGFVRNVTLTTTIILGW